jgi:predicted porin
MIGAVLAGTAVSAAADVKVSGHIDEAILFWDAEASGTGYLVNTNPSTPTYTSGSFSTSADDANLVCTTCSIGFSGSEDLGNGLKAIFKLDWEYDINNRNNNITDRDQWVGLAGGFGKVVVGTTSTIYKSHGAMIDPLYRTAAQARGIGLQSHYHSGAGEEAQGRATNTFRWDSPDFNGIKIGATYTLDSDETDGEDDNPYSIGASYENGGLLAFVDYVTNDGTANVQGDKEAWKLGGKFAMNAFSVFGQYEDITETYTAPFDWEENVWHLGGTYTMGSNTLYAAYGQYEVDFGPSTNFDGDVFSIVGIHSFSKNTLAYAGYVQNEGDGNVSGFDLGDASPAFGDYSGYILSGNGSLEVSAFTVGMKHKF